MVPPRCACRDNCVELLELDGLLLVFARPLTLYPSLLRTVEGAESRSAAGVSVQTELGGLRPRVVEEERPAVLVVEEDVLPLDIGSACSVDSYPIVWFDLWWSYLAFRSHRRRIMVRPGTTTRAANESLPKREASPFFVIEFRELHCRRMPRRSASLSGGSLASQRTVSRRMPRKASTWDRPSFFSSARGMPR